MQKAKQYDKYQFGIREGSLVIVKGLSICCITGYLFFQNIFGILILLPWLYFYLKKNKRKRIKQVKWKLNQEFKDGLCSLSAALEAGYSAENALEETTKDLRLLYDEKAMIIQEFQFMQRQMRNGKSMEEVFREFGLRSGIDDISSFAEVFSIAKRTGGDIIRIIRSTENIITAKIEVNREIHTMISAKQFEANIMQWIPIGILAYLSFCSPEFLTPLYASIGGHGIMAVLLVIYAGLIHLSEKITAIEL